MEAVRSSEVPANFYLITLRHIWEVSIVYTYVLSMICNEVHSYLLDCDAVCSCRFLSCCSKSEKQESSLNFFLFEGKIVRALGRVIYGGSFFYPEDKDSRFSRNISNIIPDYTASHSILRNKSISLTVDTYFSFECNLLVYPEGSWVCYEWCMKGGW
jgi:hypothetical protein